jgi:preprotein translocase subunit SecG
MTVAYYFVVVFHVIACLFLIGVVLLQQGKNQDLASAFGGGGTQTAFGPRGSANVLSKATTILAGVFMVTCLALSMLRPKASSVLDQAGQAAGPAPAASAAPASVPAASVPAASVPAASVPPASAPAAAPAPAASPSAQ